MTEATENYLFSKEEINEIEFKECHYSSCYLF